MTGMEFIAISLWIFFLVVAGNLTGTWLRRLMDGQKMGLIYRPKKGEVAGEGKRTRRGRLVPDYSVFPAAAEEADVEEGGTPKE
jgi:hypothetical protein